MSQAATCFSTLSCAFPSHLINLKKKSENSGSPKRKRDESPKTSLNSLGTDPFVGPSHLVNLKKESENSGSPKIKWDESPKISLNSLDTDPFVGPSKRLCVDHHHDPSDCDGRLLSPSAPRNVQTPIKSPLLRPAEPPKPSNLRFCILASEKSSSSPFKLFGIIESRIKLLKPRRASSLIAEYGTGSRARHASECLPSDFTIESVDLMREYRHSSIIPGIKGKSIGEGSFATVILMYGRNKSKRQSFAVKEFRKPVKGDDPVDHVIKIKSEVSIARSLHHPNIIQSFGLFTHRRHWYHVMEYCPRGDLFSLTEKGCLTTDFKQILFKQLLQGVSYLHANGITHRDIKLENLLLGNDNRLKITDFGLSDVFNGPHPGLRSPKGKYREDVEVRRFGDLCGSQAYMAPELFSQRGVKHDPRLLDVWSSAIVCLILFSKKMPWESAQLGDHRYRRFLDGWAIFSLKKPDALITTTFPNCGSIFHKLPSRSLERVILRMLHPTPEKRVLVDEALHATVIQEIGC